MKKKVIYSYQALNHIQTNYRETRMHIMFSEPIVCNLYVLLTAILDSLDF